MNSILVFLENAKLNSQFEGNMEVQFLKGKIKPGKRKKFKSLLDELKLKQQDCVNSLDEQDCLLENIYVDGDNLYVVKVLTSLENYRRRKKDLNLPIYTILKQISEECICNSNELFPYMYFETEKKD